jgi:U3 small nucleolar RNA-associated protein 12
MDSLKLKGSLYGHKLPVLSMDISSDSTLLVTGSADKNIKIWGLDFNDCHKSIFAHQDSVMQVSPFLAFQTHTQAHARKLYTH